MAPAHATPSTHLNNWIVYCLVGDGVVFQFAEDAVRNDAITTAIMESKTWGEFRRALPEGEWEPLEELLLESDYVNDPEEWDELLNALPKWIREPMGQELFEHWEPEEDRPRWRDDNAPFDSGHVPGFSDGDYPRWAAQDMDEVLPDDVLEKYGKRCSSVLNGPFWHIDGHLADEVAAVLRERGYRVERAGVLKAW